MIVVVDYGMGNLHSVTQALKKIGAEPVVSDDPTLLAQATAIVLPGVGAFGDAMNNLREQGWIEPLKAAANSGKPFLGICLGMQLLGDTSEEHATPEEGDHAGLGIIPGKVVRFTHELKIPHMGWNELVWADPQQPLVQGIEEGHVYFVHSYHFVATEQTDVLATCDYGHPVTAMIGRGTVYGMQFHPEKSGDLGKQLLERFVALSAEIKF